MTEGVIVSWLIKPGDTVKSGDMIAEVETDKATMELENFEKGTILHLAAKEGEAIAVDAIIAIVGNPGEDFSALLTDAPAPAKVEESKSPVEPVAPKVQEAEKQEFISEDTRLKASPLAKKLAAEKGINLSAMQGSGDGGRIVRRDVEQYQTPSHAAASGTEGFTDVPVSQMRKTIARRLGESKFSAPHFYLTMEIRMDKAVEARTAINEFSSVKISMNDLIVKAAAIALNRHPKVNSSWLGDKIRTYHHVHIGVAMAVEEGLLVPVVKHADLKNLGTISTEVKDFSARAKEKRLQPADWEGNTFTISNLGMFGIDSFTAIINPPDACILAVGTVKDSVIVENGELKAGKIMKVTLSCDHRVVDGVVGSEFLQTLKTLLEEPVKLLA